MYETIRKEYGNGDEGVRKFFENIDETFWLNLGTCDKLILNRNMRYLQYGDSFELEDMVIYLIERYGYESEKLRDKIKDRIETAREHAKWADDKEVRRKLRILYNQREEIIKRRREELTT